MVRPIIGVSLIGAMAMGAAALISNEYASLSSSEPHASLWLAQNVQYQECVSAPLDDGEQVSGFSLKVPGLASAERITFATPHTVTYTMRATPDAVASFYSQALSARCWEQEEGKGLVFSKGNKVLSLNLAYNPLSQKTYITYWRGGVVAGVSTEAIVWAAQDPGMPPPPGGSMPPPPPPESGGFMPPPPSGTSGGSLPPPSGDSGQYGTNTGNYPPPGTGGQYQPPAGQYPSGEHTSGQYPPPGQYSNQPTVGGQFPQQGGQYPQGQYPQQGGQFSPGGQGQSQFGQNQGFAPGGPGGFGPGSSGGFGPGGPGGFGPGSPGGFGQGGPGGFGKGQQGGAGQFGEQGFGQGPQGGFGQKGGEGFGQGRPEFGGLGEGQEGSEDEFQQRIDEQRFKQMKAQMGGAEKMVKGITARMLQVEKKLCVPLPTEVKNALTEAQTIVQGIKAAEDADALEGVAMNMEDVFSTLEEAGQEIPRYFESCAKSKRIVKDVAQHEKRMISIKRKLAKNPEFGELVAGVESEISAAKILAQEGSTLIKTDIDAAGEKYDEVYAKFDDITTGLQTLELVSNIAGNVKKLDSDYKKYASAITRMKKLKKDTAVLEEQVAQFQHKVQELKDAIKNKEDRDTLANIMEEVFQIKREIENQLTGLTGSNAYAPKFNSTEKGFQFQVDDAFKFGGQAGSPGGFGRGTQGFGQPPGGSPQTGGASPGGF